MSDRDIKTWNERLSEQVAKGWDNYQRKRIDLGSARALELWAIAGEFIYVENVSSTSAKLTCKVNRNNNDDLDLESGTIIKTVFKEVYLSNTAQAGEWVDVIFGINFEYYKEHEQAQLRSFVTGCITITHANPDTNQAGASNVCNRALIKAHNANTGLVWVDFGQAAVDGACIDLPADHSISVPIQNTDQINCLFKVGGEKVSVAYEVE